MDVPAARFVGSVGLIPRFSFDRRSIHHLILVAVGCFIFFTNLGATRLWDVDEAIFSQAAVEMMQRGDLITPYYNGRLFAHKPPLMYWCQIAAFQCLGTTEFAARLFSALFCLGTLLLTYELGRTLFNARTGLWSGLALAGCINFIVIARAATPDAHLTFFCTLALLILVRGTGRRANGDTRCVDQPWQPVLPPSWATYALAYSSMAVAVLVKGPVGIVIPTAVWGMFLLIEHSIVGRTILSVAPDSTDKIVRPTVLSGRIVCPTVLTDRIVRPTVWFLKLFSPPYFLQTVWRMRPLTAILAVVLIAGPWYLLVGLRTNGEFLREFFLVQNVGRASHAMDSHQGPFFYYLIAVCVGTFPWCVLLWPAILHAVRGIRHNDPARAGYVLLCCWTGVWFGCFSLVATKLASYIVPAYPALAIGFAALIDGWLSGQSTVNCRFWLRQAWVTLAAVAVAVFIGVPIAMRILFEGKTYLALIGLIPLVGAWIGWRYTSRDQIQSAVTTLASIAVLSGVGILGFAVLPIDSYKNTHLIGESIHQNTTGAAQVGTYKYAPPSFVFYSHLTFDRLRSRTSVLQHFRDHPKDAFVITSDKHVESLRPYLPSGVTVLHSERMFLKRENVVVLGRDARVLVSKGR